MTNTNIAEITRFNALPDVSVDAVVKAVTALTPFQERCGGMISKTLMRGKDGSWTDFVVWKDKASADRALQGFRDAPEAAEIMSLIEQSSVQIMHDEIHVMS